MRYFGDNMLPCTLPCTSIYYYTFMVLTVRKLQVRLETALSATVYQTKPNIMVNLKKKFKPVSVCSYNSVDPCHKIKKKLFIVILPISRVKTKVSWLNIINTNLFFTVHCVGCPNFAKKKFRFEAKLSETKTVSLQFRETQFAKFRFSFACFALKVSFCFV